MRWVVFAGWICAIVAASVVVGAGVASLRALDHVGAALLVTSGMTALSALLRAAPALGAEA